MHYFLLEEVQSRSLGCLGVHLKDESIVVAKKKVERGSPYMLKNVGFETEIHGPRYI